MMKLIKYLYLIKMKDYDKKNLVNKIVIGEQIKP